MIDQSTITILLDEAKKNARVAERLVKKYDNYEDIAALEAWLQTVDWLESKIKTGT